ncbi:Rqc2 family fibronectin-binding protein [Aquibacillus rhizosphaerae]|uniref:Rqc2 homolog RqcH n=1 Tax=Aquibacillus rhizosphaerae TaxID=3051431 RepID=A0ABT7L3Q6_9BACI|nr:NFACT RNA binding domain-containing protein [Aquibacillus sp. LR5S19]MDL4840004.1 NFACT RNA binding domain-containing protein [Aquibacillus sp. LR5S19]
MAFDGIVTRAITHELDNELSSGRVMKIYQPTETELILTIRSHGKNKSLLLSMHPSYARFHLTSDSYQNPKEPPMFCMLLRKHLVGGFIEEIVQHENERIVFFHIKGKNEIGDETVKTLIIEVMGKHSNIFLVDKEKGHILDSIKHVAPAQNRVRTIMPGQAYKLPPDQGKLNPITVDSDVFIRKLDFNAGQLDKQLVSTFMGFSPLIAKEILHRAYLGSPETYKAVFEQLQTSLLHHQYQPELIKDKKEDFYCLSLSSVAGQREKFETMSSLLDNYYSGKAERDRVKQQAGDLYRFLKNEREKNVRKIKKHKQTLVKADKADQFQRYGELLTANMHTLKQGDKSATVIDYYDPDQNEITIELNPNKTPSENAQSYFKTYQKLKKSKKMVIQEIAKAEQEINYLDELLQQIDEARVQDIEEIREELREEGYLKTKSKHKKKKNKPTKPEPEQYVASDGTIILVGKNNKQNEFLTNRLAAKDEIWLHTKDIPGSHVVIRDKNPSDETLFEAAQLAASFSKSKNSSSVPVDYTLIRHVKKPNGAKPGFVTYDNQKTLFVTPEEDIIKKLKTK